MLEEIVGLLPLGPQYFPDEQITEDYERDIAAEMIRAVCMDMLTEEMPYSIATQCNLTRSVRMALCISTPRFMWSGTAKRQS